MSNATTRVGNPFPGLRPFREDEEYLFFGREEQVDAMVDKLAATHFLAVVGTSGSGKSSLVNCGLRPALRRGLMASAGAMWRMARFRPGGNPIRAMAEALAREGVLFRGHRSGGLPLADLVETTLRMSKKGLLDIVGQAALDAGTNLLLVVDQFEELFRFTQVGGASADRGERAAAFVNLLLEVKAQTGLPIYVVLTMRSDFLGDCTQFPGLAEAINAGQYLVPRLTRSERKAAIRGPIGVAGAAIAPILLTRLVNDVGDNPDQLSILQHALNRTWSRWQEATDQTGPIDLPHYLATGTMAAALDEHADEAFESLAPGRQREVCEKLFRALTDKATDPRGVRSPMQLGTLCEIVAENDAAATEQKPAADGTAAAEGAANAVTDEQIAEVTAVIDVFRDPSRSFLMPPADEPLTADSVIDISHESLMRVWKRLDGWATAEAESARRYRRLAESAILHREGRAALLQKQDLRVALRWCKDNQPNAKWAEQYTDAGVFATTIAFLKKSRWVSRAKSAVGLLMLAALFALPVVGWLFNKVMLDKNDGYLERIRTAEDRMSDDSRLAGQILLELEKPLLDSVAASADKMTVKILERGLQARRTHDAGPVVAHVDPEGEWVVSGDSRGLVAVWPTDGGRDIAHWSGETQVRCVQATSGNRAWVGFDDGSLYALTWKDDPAAAGRGSDVSQVPLAHAIELAPKGEGAVCALAVGGDGEDTYIATACADGRVALRDAGQDKLASYRFEPVDDGDPHPEALCVALSATASRLAAGASDGTVVVLERTDSGLQLISTGRHGDRVVSVAFGSDENSLLTTSWDGCARIWRIPDMGFVPLPHGGPVLDASWRADAKAIVTAGEDGAIVWRFDDYERDWVRCASLDGHVGAVLTADYQPAKNDQGSAPDPTRILTACEDGRLRVFELQSDNDAKPQLRLDVDEHYGAVLSARYNRKDGTIIVSSGRDHDVRVWSPDYDAQVSDAKRLKQLVEHWRALGLPDVREKRLAIYGSQLRQILADAQQIAAAGAMAPLLEDLAAVAQHIATDARLALYAPHRADVGQTAKTLTDKVAGLRKQFDPRKAASNSLGGFLPPRDGLDVDLAKVALFLEDPDAVTREVAAQLQCRHRIATAWQQLEKGKRPTEPLPELPKSEASEPEPSPGVTGAEASALGGAVATPAPFSTEHERTNPAALIDLRKLNEEALDALQHASTLAKKIDESLAALQPKTTEGERNWKRPDFWTAGAVPSAFKEWLDALRKFSAGSGTNGEPSVSDQIAKVIKADPKDSKPNATANMATQALEKWWSERQMKLVQDGADVFAVDLGALRQQAEEKIEAANNLERLPSSRRDQKFIDANTLVANFEAGRTLVKAMFVTKLLADFEQWSQQQQPPLNTLKTLRDQMEDLRDKVKPLLEPTVDWPRDELLKLPERLDDYGTEEQRRLLFWDKRRGYWYLTGRDVPMVLVASGTPDPFFIDAHEVTFADFEARMAATPGPAKDFWDRCGIVYKHAATPSSSADPDAFARYQRTLLFGVSLDAAAAYAQAAYPRRPTPQAEPSSPTAKQEAAEQSKYARFYRPKTGTAEPGDLPELKLAIPKYEEWRAAFEQQWGSAPAVQYAELTDEQMQHPPLAGESLPLGEPTFRHWDAPPGGIQGLRSGLAEWVLDVPDERDESGAARSREQPHGVVGVSLFRPWSSSWSSDIKKGRVPFDGAADYFNDMLRCSPEGASREEDAFGFRCVYRLDPYVSESEARE